MPYVLPRIAAVGLNVSSLLPQVGWLLPTRPMVSAASSSADSDPRDDGQMDVMTAPGQGAPMSRGGANNKRAVMRGDLSYDPVTGSGVGVGGMDIYA